MEGMWYCLLNILITYLTIVYYKFTIGYYGYYRLACDIVMVLLWFLLCMNWCVMTGSILLYGLSPISESLVGFN